jgi:hypothetical protein
MHTPTPTPTPTATARAIVLPEDNMPIKEIGALAKLYSNQDDKYGGDTFDILDAKLQIFYDRCNKSGI